MKFILIIIVLIIFTFLNVISFANNNNNNQYINFIPIPADADGYCDSYLGLQGLGYSILIGQCFTLDGEYSHIINKDENGTLTHSAFNVVGKNGLGNCKGGEAYYTYILGQGSCQFPPQFNIFYSNFNDVYLVNITVTNEIYQLPIPSNIYVNSYFSSINKCINGNPYLIEFLAGSPSTQADDSNITFECTQNGTPTQVLCPIPQRDSSFSEGCKTVNEQSLCSKEQSNIYKSVTCSQIMM